MYITRFSWTCEGRRARPAANAPAHYDTLMKHTFKYDVAISAVDFDALAATELQRRLEQRLRQAIFASVASATSPRSPAAVTTARHAFEKDARVVVVLFQRLWGATLSTEADATAIRARIAKSGRRGVGLSRKSRTPQPLKQYDDHSRIFLERVTRSGGGRRTAR